MQATFGKQLIGCCYWDSSTIPVGPYRAERPHSRSTPAVGFREKRSLTGRSSVVVERLAQVVAVRQRGSFSHDRIHLFQGLSRLDSPRVFLLRRSRRPQGRTERFHLDNGHIHSLTLAKGEWLGRAKNAPCVNGS